MKNYAKIKDNGSIFFMPSPRHISNPSTTILASWAREQNYKELRSTVAPSRYHTRSYREYNEHISCVWSKPTLDNIKTRKKKEADSVKEQALQSSTVLIVERVGGVLYDMEAQLNIMGLLVMGKDLPASIDFTLADDSVVALDYVQLQSIALAFESHKTAIHVTKRESFAAIDAALSVEDLLN